MTWPTVLVATVLVLPWSPATSASLWPWAPVHLAPASSLSQPRGQSSPTPESEPSPETTSEEPEPEPSPTSITVTLSEDDRLLISGGIALVLLVSAAGTTRLLTR